MSSKLGNCIDEELTKTPKPGLRVAPILITAAPEAQQQPVFLAKSN